MKQTVTLNSRTVQMSPPWKEVNDKVYNVRNLSAASSRILSRLYAEFIVCPNTQNTLNVVSPAWLSPGNLTVSDKGMKKANTQIHIHRRATLMRVVGTLMALH